MKQKFGNLIVEDLKKSYNSLENPIGIETYVIESYIRCNRCYNSLENPIGIETVSSSNPIRQICERYNSLENPIGIETSAATDAARRNMVTTH